MGDVSVRMEELAFVISFIDFIEFCLSGVWNEEELLSFKLKSVLESRLYVKGGQLLLNYLLRFRLISEQCFLFASGLIENVKADEFI